MDTTNGQINKALVGIAIEKTLLNMGTLTLEEVGKKLYSKYNAYFPDCYDHPEYLNDILKGLYGRSYTTIINSIKEELDEFASKRPIKEFLSKISE